MKTNHVAYAIDSRIMQAARDAYANFRAPHTTPTCLVADGIERGILLALACPEWAWAALREDSECDCGDACTKFDDSLAQMREWVAQHPLPQTEA